MDSSSKPKIVEHFRELSSPSPYTEAVRQLLDRLPESLTEGLDVVILRDEASLTRKERQKGFEDSCGVYLKPASGRPVQIHLVLDQILSEWPRWAHRTPIFKNEIVFRMLFHELAHHAHEQKTPGKRHVESEIRRAGIELHTRSLRERYPISHAVFRRTYATLDPFVRPWILRSSPLDESFKKRWYRRWTIRWAVALAAGILLMFLAYKLPQPAARQVLFFGGALTAVFGLYGTIALPLGDWVQARQEEAEAQASPKRSRASGGSSGGRSIRRK